MKPINSKTDAALLNDTKELVRRENTQLAELIVHLQIIDRRRLYAKLGYSSIFEYVIRELHLSESAAFVRIRAARIATTFPAVLIAVADGKLHLSGLVVLAPHLKPDNVDELIAAATHKSKREIENLVARLAPQPPQAMVLRAAPAPTPAPALALALALAPQPAQQSAAPVVVAPAAPAAPITAAQVKPMAPDRYRLHLDVSSRILELLDELRDLHGAPVTDSELSRLLEETLASEVERRRKQKFATTDKPRSHAASQPASDNDAPDAPAPVKPASRAIPAAVRRAVSERDEFRCTFVGENGRQCDSRSALEFHHVHPFARGGQHTVDGVTLRCRTHNLLAAEQDFGKHAIDAAVCRRRSEAVSKRALAGGSPLSTGAARRQPCDTSRATRPVGNDESEPHDSAATNSRRQQQQPLGFGG